VKEIKRRRQRVYDVQAGSHLGKELLDQSCGGSKELREAS